MSEGRLLVFWKNQKEKLGKVYLSLNLAINWNRWKNLLNNSKNLFYRNKIKNLAWNWKRFFKLKSK